MKRLLVAVLIAVFGAWAFAGSSRVRTFQSEKDKNGALAVLQRYITASSGENNKEIIDITSEQSASSKEPGDNPTDKSAPDKRATQAPAALIVMPREEVRRRSLLKEIRTTFPEFIRKNSLHIVLVREIWQEATEQR